MQNSINFSENIALHIKQNIHRYAVLSNMNRPIISNSNANTLAYSLNITQYASLGNLERDNQERNKLLSTNVQYDSNHDDIQSRADLKLHFKINHAEFVVNYCKHENKRCQNEYDCHHCRI